MMVLRLPPFFVARFFGDFFPGFRVFAMRGS
jgi:hypothetical protein